MSKDQIVNGQYQKYQAIIEKELRKIFQNLKGCPEELKRSMEYAVFSGGKRLRPVLTLLTYTACGGKSIRDCLPFACGIEFIHTFSLIHDDLPALDNDDWRRGKPTLHKVFGEGIALLAGDCLFALAFEIFLKAVKMFWGRHFREGNPALLATEVILQSVGIKGMVGGQVMDIQPTSRRSKKLYIPLIKKKTAFLIQASILSGAILAHCDTKRLRLLRQAGLLVGILFQLSDDIIDQNGSVKIYGQEKVIALRDRYAKKAKRLFEKLDKGFEPFLAIIKFITTRSE